MRNQPVIWWLDHSCPGFVGPVNRLRSDRLGFWLNDEYGILTATNERAFIMLEI